MSYVSHNPELYTELQVKGVMGKLTLDIDDPSMVAAIQALAEETDSLVQIAWRSLCGWASREIEIAEGDHFAGEADWAHERMRDRNTVNPGPCDFRPLAPNLPVVEAEQGQAHKDASRIARSLEELTREGK